VDDLITDFTCAFSTVGVDMATGALSAGRDSLGGFDPWLLAGFTCQFRIHTRTDGGLA
jgi:hypothetical protein